MALKVLSAQLASDPDRRERFEREARAAAALNHPNIVTIHFGLAKVTEEARLAEDAMMPTAVELTGEGRIVGTVAYMHVEE